MTRAEKVAGISVFARDITDRIQASAALKQSEERFRTLIEKAPVAVGITRGGLNVYGNAKFLESFGFQRMGDIQGRPIIEQWAPECREDVTERVRKRASGLPSPTEFDGIGLRLDGSRFPMHVAVSNVHLPDGQATIAFVLDLTERKRAEEAMARNEAELAAIYENTPIMMCLVNAQRQVERMNRTMANFVGPAQSPVDRHGPGDILGCINAEDDERGCGFGKGCHACAVRLAVRKTLDTGEPCHQVQSAMELIKSGARRELHVSVSTAPVRLQGEPKVLVCLEDVTTHRQMEMQLRQAQKMEAVGQLAGGVAHDFNNILAATLLHLDILQSSPDIRPDMLDSLKELEQGMHRAANLTRQLLLFSRREVMQVQRVALNDLIDGVFKMLKRLLGEHITIDFQPSAESPAVEADPGMIEQVVINLSVNARDAMPKGGRLTLGTQLLNITAQEANRHPEARVGLFTCLCVKDTGCGMDESTLIRIFEPFFTTKGPGKGTGLGLATVFGIVQQHHGWVQVESAVGCGSTFRVFLPATDRSQISDSSRTEIKPMGGSETILLVEDEERVGYVVKMSLRLFKAGGFTADPNPLFIFNQEMVSLHPWA